MYLVTFQTGKRLLQLHCRQFQLSELHGLYELSDIVFSDSKILLHEEEILKHEFKDVERILLPWTAILRVDQMRPDYNRSEGPKLLSQDEPGASGPIVVDFRRKGD